MRNSVRTATAYHEAGHAVAAIVRGVPFAYVTADHDAVLGAAGHIRFLPERAEFEATHKRAVVALAGEAAQRRFNPRSIRRAHGSADREAVAGHAHRLSGGSRQVAQILVRLWEQQARELVAGFWAEIEHVATVLTADGRLTRAECVSVLAFERSPRTDRGERATSPTPGTLGAVAQQLEGNSGVQRQLYGLPQGTIGEKAR